MNADFSIADYIKSRAAMAMSRSEILARRDSGVLTSVKPLAYEKLRGPQNAVAMNELAAFPPLLRELIEAELKAGNTIVEIASAFPAPPVGAYVLLKNPVSTRPRKSADGIKFIERCYSSHHSGEFTDEGQFFFVLEPPYPQAPEPDMNAIRAELAEKERIATNEWFDKLFR